MSRMVLFSVMLCLAGCKVDLYTNLSEEDAVQMWAILLDHGLDGEKFVGRNGTFGLKVEESQVARAVQILKECGYPRKKFENGAVLFKKEGLISSPLEERARFLYALSQSLEETLTNIDGVQVARVHIVMPETTPFSERVAPASASVLIKHNPEANLSRLKTAIKLVITKSIEGLDYSHVTLALVPASNLTRCGHVPPATGS